MLKHRSKQQTHIEKQTDFIAGLGFAVKGQLRLMSHDGLIIILLPNCHMFSRSFESIDELDLTPGQAADANLIYF